MALSQSPVDKKAVAMLALLKIFRDMEAEGVTTELLAWFLTRVRSWINVDTARGGEPPIPPDYFSLANGVKELLCLNIICRMGDFLIIRQWAADTFDHDWPWARQFLTPGILHFLEFERENTPRYRKATIPEAPQILERTQDPVNPKWFNDQTIPASQSSQGDALRS